MNRFRCVSGMLFILFFSFFIFSGAVKIKKASHAMLLKPVLGLAQSSHFTRLHQAPDGSEHQERLKIAYLIDRVRSSNREFIRNGEEFSSQKAASHLEFKYRVGYSRVHSARDFIEGIAAGSMTTGEPYLVEIENDTFYLRDVMLNELELLEQSLETDLSSSG